MSQEQDAGRANSPGNGLGEVASRTGFHVPPPPSGPLPGARPWVIVGGTAVLIAVFWLGAVVGAGGGLGRLWMVLRGGQATSGTATAVTQYYTCGMHPWVVLPRPGDCPICGMRLVPLDPAKFTGEVTIDPVAVQNIGVRVSPVILGPLTQTMRTVGTVAYDETRVRDVNIKIGGWIEKLHVDYLGSPVKKGQPLFELYSPELYAAQEEYLLAWRNRNKMGSDSAPDASQGAKDLLGSARTRLEYFDVSAGQIEELQKRGTPAKTITMVSPYDGVVIAKNVVEGMKVEAGTQIYRIVDLSKVWVMATLYEYQLPFVQVGQNATMTLSYVPGQTFRGQVIYIYPYLNDRTRQVEVRLECENPGLMLKPGMYATVEIHSTLARDRTLVPRSAILDTGERKIAFVSLGNGRFDPRPVRTGDSAQDGLIEVLDGLKPGEQVVTSGQFLLDSESNVREALAKMIRGNPLSDQAAASAESGGGAVMPVETARPLEALLHDYLAIHEKLAADTIGGIAAPAEGIAQRIDELLKVTPQDDPHFWHRHEEVAIARGKALELAQSGSLEEARLRFADLSIALGKLLSATGIPRTFGKEVQELHCPMFRPNQGGTIWLQLAGEVRNPYFGSTMPGCFDQRKTLPIAGTVKAAPQAGIPGQAPTQTAPMPSDRPGSDR